jgi:hypothetical protein
MLLLPPPGLYCPEPGAPGADGARSRVWLEFGGACPTQRSLTVGVVWRVSVFRRLAAVNRPTGRQYREGNPR